MADKIVSWGGIDSRSTSGIDITGSVAITGSTLTIQSAAPEIRLVGSATNVGTKGIYFYHSSRAAWVESPSGGAGDSGGLTLGAWGQTFMTANGTYNSFSSVIFSYPVSSTEFMGASVNSGTHYYSFNNGEKALRIASTRLGSYGRQNLKIMLRTALSGTDAGDADTFFYVPGTNKNISINSATTDLGAQLGVRGSGTTSSTTALLVQNSAASPSLTITDDKASTFNGNVTIGSSSEIDANSRSLVINGGYGNTSSDKVLLYLTATNNVGYGVGSKQWIYFGNGGVATSAKIGGINLGNNNYESGLVFNTTSGGSDYEVMRITNSQNVGIGTTSPTAKLHVENGSALVKNGSLTVNSTSAQIGIINAGSGNKAWSFIMSGNDLQVREDGIGFPMVFKPAGDIVTNQNGGNLLIGTTTGTAKLQVKSSGTTSSTTALLVQNANASNMLSLTDNGALTLTAFQTSSTSITVNRTLGTMGSNFNLATMGSLVNLTDTVGNSNASKTTLYINTAGASQNNALIVEAGYVGFGTTSPGSGFNSAYFTTLAGLRVNYASDYQITSRDYTSRFNTLSGGGISFWGDASGQASGQTAYAGIRGLKANNTYVNPLGNLAFYVQTGSSSHVVGEGTFKEVGRFNELGYFGIGTSTPAYTLDVSGSARFINSVTVSGSLVVGSGSIGGSENTITVNPPTNAGTGEGGQILLAAAGGTYTSASMLDNYQNSFRVLRGTNAGSDGYKFKVDLHSGQVQIPNYNGPAAFSGAPVANLSVDTTGNVLTSAGYTGTVTIVTNPPGQQNLDFQNGILVNVF